MAQEFEPWRQAGYWKALQDRAVQRQALLQQEVEQLRAQLRLREQQLFGRKAETRAAATPAATGPDDPPRRPRGQQRGQKGPSRRDYSHLPAVIEDRDIPGAACWCRRCGRPFAPVSGTADSTILEIEVQAHRRVIRRRRYRPHLRLRRSPRDCHRPAGSAGDPQEHPGVSILVEVLVDNTCPTARLTGCSRTSRRAT